MKIFFTNTLFKICLLLTVVVGSAGFAQAQIAMTRSTFAGTYAPITGTVATAAQVDGGVVTAIPIGFSFNYLGTAYTTATMASDGWLSFVATTSSASNSSLATTTTNATLAPWWDDLITSSAQYSTTGVSGSQVFTAQWVSNSYWSGSTRAMNYQVRLYEGTNVIEFWYGSISGTNANGSVSESASIGIKNATGGPGNYLDAISGAAFIANGTLNSAQFPSQNFRFTPGAPTALGAGTYNVGVGQTYTTLTEAVADINHRGISGAVVLNLSDATYTDKAAGGSEVFPIVFGPVAGTSATNTITVQGNAADLRYAGSVAGLWANGSATGTMFGTTAEPILGVAGCDFLTVNNLKLTALTGIVFGTGTGTPTRADKGLAVQNNTATNGAKNNTFSNITVTLDRTNTNTAALDQGQTVTATAQTGCNDNNTYQNWTVKNCYAGMSLGAGGTTFLDDNNKINSSSCSTYNIIGDPATANDIGNGTVATYGIKATGQSNMTIANCKIQNITSTSTAAIDGIYLPNSGATTTSLGTCSIYNNFISGLTATSASSGQVGGLRINTTNNAGSIVRVYNNFVSGLTSASTVTATRRIIGIRAQDAGTGTAGTISFDFNSVSIAPAGIACSNACFELGTTSGAILKIRNNIFSNTTAAQTTAKHYCFVTTSATSIGATTITNYNDLYVANTNGFVGLGNTTDYATLANWTAGITTPATPDANSISINPQFAGANDLHVSALGLNGAGDPAVATNSPWVTTDINCEARPQPSGNFDIGADEISACTGAPTAGTLSGAGTVCVGSSTTLTLSGNTIGAGIAYQWYSGTTAGGPYPTALGTSVTQATGVQVADTYYAVSVTCSVSGQSAITPEKLVALNAVPTPTIAPSTSLICGTGTSVLTASGGVSYVWAANATLSATNIAAPTASPTTATTYTVTATAANGCTASATVALTTQPGVTATASATPATVCAGANSVLLAAASTQAYDMTSTPYAYVTPVSPTTITLSSTDDGNATVAMPFAFTFFGTSYTTAYVHSNGFISFTAAQPTGSPYNEVIPTAATPNNYVALCHDDLNTTGGTVTHFTTGTAPNRVWVVEYNNVKFYNSAANSGILSGQVKFYETTNVVETHITEATDPVPSVHAIGIENATGTLGYSPAGRNSNDANWSVAAASPEAWRFAPASMTYLWSPATFLSSASVSNPSATAITATTTYIVTVTASTSCTTTSSITITAGATLSTTPTATAATICAGQTSVLNAGVVGGGGPFTYTWDNGAAATVNPSVSPIATTTYYVTVSDACGASVIGSVTVTVNAIPTPSIAPSTSLICGTGTSVLTASGGASYAWAANASLSATNIAAPTATPTATTTYTVTATNAANCTATATYTLTFAPATAVTATAAPATICAGATSDLTATASPVLPAYCASTHSSGCSGDEITNVTLGTINNASSGCGSTSHYTYFSTPTATQTTELTAGAPASLSLSFGGDGNQYFGAWIDYNQDGVFSPTEFLGASANAGASGTIAVAFTTDPAALSGVTRLRIVGGNDSPITAAQACGASSSAWGETQDFNVTIIEGVEAFTYAWSNSLGTANTVTTPALTTNTSYTVTATASSGCTATTTVAVTVSIPTITTSNITNTCPTTTVNLNTGITSSTTGLTVQFYTAADLATEITGTGITAAATGTTYYVKVTNTTGCTATASVVVTTTSCCTNPTITSVTTDVACFGGTTGSIALTQTGGDAITTYAWTGSASTTATATGLSVGSYDVTVTAGLGCSTVLSGLGVVQPTAALSLNATATNNTACTTANGTATFTAADGTAPYTYANATNADMLTGLAAGSYTTIVTDNKGCMATATATLADAPIFPTATLIKSGNLNCANAATGVTLTAGTGAEYDFGTGFAVPNTFIAMTANTYTVTVKGANGCTANSSIAVTSNTTAPVANVMGSFAFCTGASTALIASPGFATYAWSGGTAGATTNKRTFTTAGTYNVTITAANGCTTVKTFTTVINSKPTLTGVSMPTVCAGSDLQGSVTMTSAIAATTTWTAANGFTATGTSISRNPATTAMSGLYIIRATNTCGTTSASATATVKAIMPITVAVNNASTLGGSTGSIYVTAPAGSTFSWVGSAVTTGQRTGLPTGTYTVTVSPPLGSPYCPVTRSIVIN